MALANRRLNLYRRATAIIYFQKFPGKINSAGIQGLKYEVRVGGKKIQSGSTDNKGRAVLFFDRTKQAELKIMGMTYKITVINRLAGPVTVKGVKQRLNMLGYNSGKAEGNYNNVVSDRAILNFQADTSGMKMDGLAARKTRRKIKNAVGE